MAYPNLIFINQNLEAYLDERVEKPTTPWYDIAMNAVASIANKTNNIGDVIKKVSDISDLCRDANKIQNEAENAAEWVKIAIILGELAFKHKNHESHNIMHMLRTYILHCAETWLELQLQLAKKTALLNKTHINIERAIIKGQDPKEGVPEASQPSKVGEQTTSQQNPAKDKADEVKADEDKTDYTKLSSDKLAELRDTTVRSLVYLGTTNYILRPDIGYQKFFPHLKLTDKIQPVKFFTFVKTLPLELHHNYFLYHFAKKLTTLEDFMAETVQRHNEKYGLNKPAFLKPTPAPVYVNPFISSSPALSIIQNGRSSPMTIVSPRKLAGSSGAILQGMGAGNGIAVSGNTSDSGSDYESDAESENGIEAKEISKEAANSNDIKPGTPPASKPTVSAGMFQPPAKPSTVDATVENEKKSKSKKKKDKKKEKKENVEKEKTSTPSLS